MEWVEEKYYWKKDKKINGTTTQNQITETTTDSQSYWNGCWKLKLLKQLLKTEITGIITNSVFHISRIICNNGKNSWHYEEEVIKRTPKTLWTFFKCI